MAYLLVLYAQSSCLKRDVMVVLKYRKPWLRYPGIVRDNNGTFWISENGLVARRFRTTLMDSHPPDFKGGTSKLDGTNRNSYKPRILVAKMHCHLSPTSLDSEGLLG